MAPQPSIKPVGKKPLLTVGMAHHSDFFGVWQTLTDLRLDFLDISPLIEVVVINNSPQNDHGKAVENYLGWITGGIAQSWDGREYGPGSANTFKDKPRLVPEHFADLKYMPLAQTQGTTQSRNKIFEVASADYVLVIDCHVKLWPKSLHRLIDFYETNQDHGNLLQGPMIYDNFDTYHTHMDDVIRGNMKGVWGVDPRGFDLDADPFEIPAHGLGLFSCRKSAWPGFNKDFRGFGGEEYYIHDKFRKAGKQTLCLPFLRWVHRFDRPGGTGYTNDLRHRVRNYLLGAKELGQDIDRYRKYFLHGIPEDPKNDDPNRGRIGSMDWESLCIDLGLTP